ncbi:hypothetical protein [Mucilaginibacter auburnensis]|uniref:Lipoprotein n=1 Tax=Mucilaginibacter auburnensis TaxID=1457233 RepID=A0A2H9VNV4_9SPHI|nr:hypothetical protein [Mucilaginibacter auburnensis]PJJ80015.1 hypothetical protein CLV57_3157 [Mucilaginibacter auburnensis]
MERVKNLFLLLFAAIVITGCGSSNATVTCKKVEKFQSDAGIINIPQFKVGDAILLDTVKKVGTFILNSEIADADISASAPIDSTVILTETGFDINLSGDVSKASASVQANVKSTISRNTTFFLANSVRKNISNPFNEINKPGNMPAIKSALVNNKNTVCMFVTGIVYADKFEFRIKNSAGGSANANILKFGNFSIQIAYTCQGDLKIDAKNGGIFYKPSFYGLNAAKDQLLLQALKIDLSGYNFYQALKVY